MTVELTEQQRQAIQERGQEPVEVVDSASTRAYVLLAREEYERLRSLVADAEADSALPEAALVILPGMRSSQEAYWRDLPQLLSKQKLQGRWVCYHGDKRIALAKTSAELVQQCLRMGLQRGDFYVGRIKERPSPPWEAVPLEESHFERPQR